MGEPSSSMNCLRLVPVFSADPFPMRVPRPAAGNITATFMCITILSWFFDRGSFRAEIGHGLRVALAHRPVVLFRTRRGGVHALVELAENHLSGGGLEHAGDRDFDGLG